MIRCAACKGEQVQVVHAHPDWRYCETCKRSTLTFFYREGVGEVDGHAEAPALVLEGGS